MGSTTHATKYTAMNDSVPALRKYWDFVFMELSDPRTKDWPLLASPLPGLGILAGYLIFVKIIGPWYMQDRKPFNLHKTLILYNAAQVAISIHLVYEALDAVWLTKYSYFRCEPVDWSVTPETMRIARGFYLYFLAKISELLDTVFFVLRKKDRQVTFLHLYHHTTMPMVAWGAAKYYPGGHGSFIGLINSFVHIVMYTYYMFAAMGPQFQKYLWWKKYLTVLQLIQFLLTFYHFLQLLWSDCDYPKWSVVIVVPNAIFFYYLFSDFYKKAYRKHNEKEEDQDDEEDDDDNENVVSNRKKHD